MKTTLHTALALFLLAGCSGSTSITGPDGTSTDGSKGGGNGVIEGNPAAPLTQDVCASAAAQNRPAGPRPVDIIFVIDNSGSMTSEIQEVERNINVNFAQIIQASGVDYRVILIAKHGSATVDQSICILAPLSGNTSCSPPALAPVNGSRFFHYNSEIDSNNSLAEILRTYKARDLSGLAPTGWSAWLRPDAHRVFVEITDDESEPLTAEQFEQALLGLVPGNFGDALRRDYTFHTIGGFGANTPANTAWKPTAPIQTSICTLAVGEGGVAASIEYQKLSLATGGLRYPICQYASFDAIFREVANNVVSSPQVACELKIPTPPNGQKITSAFVTYVPGNGAAPIQLTSVPDAASCAPNSFFVTSGYVRLCSDTCAQIRSDDRAKLEVKASCLAPLG